MLLNRILRQRYKIIESIGRGGFGDTYKAIDLDFPGKRQCLVKHFFPKNSDPEAVAIAKRLFNSEARCLSRLGEHSQIPRLYSYFEEDEEFYLVQEFIEGHELTQEFQSRKRWSEIETVKLLRELLEILFIVHQENAIHRDIKPANIMRRYSDGKLVLIDFGAVKEILTVDRQGQTNLNLTIGIGTGLYMPPEQAMGRPGKYSDIYAVGMLGIQALTGLTSEELLENSDKLQGLWNDLDIEVSSQFKEVLDKMVSFQFTQRYQNAAEALKAITPTEIIAREKRIDLPDTTQIIATQSKKLWLISLGAIGLAGAGISALVFLNKPNYTQLETYLQNQQWQQADVETNRILLTVAGETSALDAEAIDDFPCKVLQKIDKLWTVNSKNLNSKEENSEEGRFGFTPQKIAYLDTGNQFGQYIESAYKDFGDRVKWRTFGTWSLYGDLMFSALAPVGHLPSPGRVSPDKRDLRYLERGMLLSRFDACDSEEETDNTRKKSANNAD